MSAIHPDGAGGKRMNAIEPHALRQALGTFVTGVTIVTARHPNGGDIGVTANSFNSVSLDPPMVLWSLNRASSSLPAFVESGGFAVHILAADQRELSNRFASRREDRFEGLTVERGFAAAPLLPGCAARFECRLAFRYDGGDHEILVGEVVNFVHSDAVPLVYHGGRYGAVTPSPPDTASDEGRGGELMHLVSRVYHQLFAAEREEFARRGLSEEGYLLLRLIGTQEGQTIEALAKIAMTAGTDVTEATAASLESRGEVARGAGDALWLTPVGRQAMVELAAVRLAREEQAIKPLDRSESRALKELLRDVARHGTVGRPQAGS